MKTCPQCKRVYEDATLNFCLEDGEWLVETDAQEPATAILHSTGDVAEAPTRAQFHTTDQTAISTGIDDTANRARGFDKRLLVFPVLLAIIGTIGFLGYRYFTPATSERINSIAVLPFQNTNSDADYLSDGLADSLIFRLSQLPDLKVSPTSSVIRYKGKEVDIGQVARELDVDAVMSGRLMQVGDNLNISVQLIDANSKKLLWAEQYDRKMADLLSTQREIATAITQKLQLRLSGEERGIAKKYTNSNEAYQLYLKGRFHWAKRKKDDLFIAIDSFKKAIELDPNFALAYVGIAEAYNSMGKNPDVPPKEAIPLAKAAAAKALELDPLLAEAHSAMGDSLAIGDWNWAESEREFKRAIELDPNISYIHVAYSGSYLTAVARADDAIAETQRALDLEPLALITNSVHVTSYINARQYDKALVQARRAYELDPDFPLARHWLGLALIANGKYEEAIALGKEVQPQSPSWVTALFVTAYAHAKAGRRAEAEQTIAAMRETAKTRYVRPYYVACVYAALGDKDKAFAELERSFAEKDCYLPRANVDPAMDPLRDDPRFKDLLKRMNLTE